MNTNTQSQSGRRRGDAIHARGHVSANEAAFPLRLEHGPVSATQVDAQWRSLLQDLAPHAADGAFGILSLAPGQGTQRDADPQIAIIHAQDCVAPPSDSYRAAVAALDINDGDVLAASDPDACQALRLFQRTADGSLSEIGVMVYRAVVADEAHRVCFTFECRQLWVDAGQRDPELCGAIAHHLGRCFVRSVRNGMRDAWAHRARARNVILITADLDSDASQHALSRFIDGVESVGFCDQRGEVNMALEIDATW